MLFRCLLLLFCIAVSTAQKGGRRASASETSPVQRAVQLARKGIDPPPEFQQVQEPDRDPAEDVDAGRRVRPSQPDDGPEPEAGHAAPEPYSFSYAVEDPESGAASSREETQDVNGEIVGYYHIRDQDGRTRRVDYTAGKDGFKATIKSNEEGLSARQPADVRLELNPSPSERINRIAPNNRPQASETSLKSFARPVQNKFYQNVIPTTRYPPPPPEVPDESQDISQLTQQYQDEEDEQQILAARPFESVKGVQSVQSSPLPPPRPRPVQPRPVQPRPVQPRPIQPPQPIQPVQPVQPLPQYQEPEYTGPQYPVEQQPITVETLPPVTVPARPPVRPTQRPITVLTPIREQTYREQGLVNLQPIQTPLVFQQQPQTQYEDDLNQVQEPIEVIRQPPPPVRPQPLPQPSPPQPRPNRILIPSQPPIRITSTDPFPPLSRLPSQPSVQAPQQPVLSIPPRPPAPVKSRQQLQTIRLTAPPTLPTTLPPPPPQIVEIQTPAVRPAPPVLSQVNQTPPPPIPRPSLPPPAPVQQTIENPAEELTPIQPIVQTSLPSSGRDSGIGTFFISQQHREPITQQQLLEFFQPLTQQQLVAITPQSTPQSSVSYDGPSQARPISFIGGSGQGIMTIIPQRFSNGLQYIVHREQDTYQLPVLPLGQQQGQQQQQQPDDDDNSVIQQEQDREEPPQESDPVQQTREEQAESDNIAPTSQPGTLQTQPTSPSPLPQPQPLFEPQVYEPQTQITYDPPTQQLYEQTSQQIENLFRPAERCQCAERAAEQTQVYPIKGAQSAPVERTVQLRESPPSPASNLNLFLPQAFRSRRDSSSNENIETIRLVRSPTSAGDKLDTDKTGVEAQNSDRS